MRETLSNQTPTPISKRELIRIRTKAKRRRIWFSRLTKLERAQINLTIKFVQKVRSSLLSRVLISIMRKMMDVIEGRVMCAMRDVGCGLTEKISRIARSWGNQSASEWMEDRGFTRYLTIMWMNTS